VDPGSGFSIQPGEFAKLALTVFFAGCLTSKRQLLADAGRRVFGLRFARGRDAGPLLGVWGFSVLVLVIQKDLGMAVLLFAVFTVCLYVGTSRISWVLIGSVLFAGIGVGAYFTMPHVHTRVAVWLDAFAYPNSGYQMRQSLFGLASGGLFGTGLGSGHPDLVPLARSDFILAAFGEELGLFGLVAILAIYALMIVRGVHAAMRTRDDFGRLLAAALPFTLGFQVFIVTAGGDQFPPGDRFGHAGAVLRRIVPGRQPRPYRDAAAHLGSGQRFPPARRQFPPPFRTPSAGACRHTTGQPRLDVTRCRWHHLRLTRCAPGAHRPGVIHGLGGGGGLLWSVAPGGWPVFWRDGNG